MTTQEYIKQVGKLICFFRKYKWIQYNMAETKSGIPVHYNDDSAACFCIIGACSKIIEPNVRNYKHFMFNLNKDLSTKNSLRGWNDRVCKSKAMLIRSLKLVIEKHKKIIQENENKLRKIK